jgi:hypothetical protein
MWTVQSIQKVCCFNHNLFSRSKTSKSVIFESSPELRGQFETSSYSSNYSEEAEILLAEMERQDDETNEKHKENPGTNNGCANCNKS